MTKEKVPESEESDQDIDPKLKLQDLLKSAVVGGLSAVFSTEDTIRGFLKEKNLPKEWAGELLSLASKRKEDIQGLIGRELSYFFKHIDIQKEVATFLRNHDLKISAEVSFLPKKDKRGENV